MKYNTKFLTSDKHSTWGCASQTPQGSLAMRNSLQDQRFCLSKLWSYTGNWATSWGWALFHTYILFYGAELPLAKHTYMWTTQRLYLNYCISLHRSGCLKTPRRTTCMSWWNIYKCTSRWWEHHLMITHKQWIHCTIYYCMICTHRTQQPIQECCY